ncbi:MAG TPA: SrtB family sortase [Clostridiales bacterium]|nr:SrtB family sortase [Clostridiales bacterium]
MWKEDEDFMKWRKILIVICIGVFLYSAWQIVSYFYDNYKSKSTYDKIRDEYKQQLEIEKEVILSTNKSGNSLITISPDILDIPAKSEKIYFKERYLSLIEINKDVVGWISIPNTVIDYPVVQAEDNNFYLRRNIHGEKATAGTIFMDYKSNALAEGGHIILYGHHMRNGTMFKDLVKYKEEDFFQNHENIQYNTLTKEMEWEVFSVYISKADFNYRLTEFSSEMKYLEFLHKLEDKSMFKKEIELSEDDQILTLSTCTYEYDDARLVVHARRVME